MWLATFLQGLFTLERVQKLQGFGVQCSEFLKEPLRVRGEREPAGEKAGRKRWGGSKCQETGEIPGACGLWEVSSQFSC